MFGIGKALSTLVVGGLSLFGVVELGKMVKAKVGKYALTSGHSYVVKVRFGGSGGGGPISQSQLQAMLDAELGAGSTVVGGGATSTDGTKLITYVMHVPSGSPVLTGAQLANVPAPWAPGHFVDIDDVGTIDIPSPGSSLPVTAAGPSS